MALTLLASLLAHLDGSVRVIDNTRPPTIVMILTDDQRWDTLLTMPQVQRHLVAHGVTFTNAFVVNSYCCPSRASILTGNYSHTTGIWTNGEGGWGGFARFHALGEERSTVATRLQAAGYRTALVGKYLNNYGLAGAYVPPGWDEWFSFSMANGAYYDYLVNHDGRLEYYGDGRGDHSMPVLTNEAVHIIRETPEGQPLFLYFAPFAPHVPATPEPRDGNAVRVPRPSASFNEADVSDKPPFIRKRSLVGEGQRAGWWRAQLISLQDVDRAVGRLVEALRATGRLDDALVVFTSDNGIMTGEHRWTHKLVAYEDSIRVPLVIRFGQDTWDGWTDARPVLNIDLAPTFVAVGARTAMPADGRSLVPVLERTGGGWRQRFLIEHVAIDPAGPPTFCAVRGTRWKYTRYADGFEELYDLRRDPSEMTNLAGTATAQDRLSQMRRITRNRCVPRPPGMPVF